MYTSNMEDTKKELDIVEHELSSLKKKTALTAFFFFLFLGLVFLAVVGLLSKIELPF